MSSNSLLAPNQPSVDSFGRTIDYLRISVTDRCNERCLYCMPEGYGGWTQRSDHLTANEIIQAAKGAAALGFRKFRLTGGEPLLRTDLVEIARGLWTLPGVETLGISTNGTRLAPLAQPLKQAGVRSVNISLDTLNPNIYRAITGGDLGLVLQGIEAALKTGFEVVKLNCVLMRGVNESDLLPLIDFAAKRQTPLRFIELMPLSHKETVSDSNFLSTNEVMNRLKKHGQLIPLTDYRPGHGPACYYEFFPSGAKLGFIGALTTPHFCETCNKLRLTADGKLRPCLGQHGEIDLLHALRSGTTDTETLLRLAISNKPENHEFGNCYNLERPMIAIGG